MGFFSSKKPTKPAAPAPLPRQLSKVKEQASLLNAKHHQNGSNIKLPDLAKTHGLASTSSSAKPSARPAAKAGVKASSIQLNQVKMVSKTETKITEVTHNHYYGTTTTNKYYGVNFGDGSAAVKGSVSGSIFKIL